MTDYVPSDRELAEVQFGKRVQKPIRKRKRRSKVGKLGILRLAGKDMEAARRRVFERDGYRCVRCGRSVTWESGELAHRRTKRNHGDADSNMEVSCKRCHRVEHGLKWSNGRQGSPKREAL
jgi:5-methylcytosine-specific restriction endonuclease McrA